MTRPLSPHRMLSLVARPERRERLCCVRHSFRGSSLSGMWLLGLAVKVTACFFFRPQQTWTCRLWRNTNILSPFFFVCTLPSPVKGFVVFYTKALVGKPSSCLSKHGKVKSFQHSHSPSTQPSSLKLDTIISTPSSFNSFPFRFFHRPRRWLRHFSCLDSSLPPQWKSRAGTAPSVFERNLKKGKWVVRCWL